MSIPRPSRLLLLLPAAALVLAACQPSPPPPNRLPVGELTITRTPAGIEVDATASDPDSPGTPVEVRATVNGTRRATGTADLAERGRTDRWVTTVADLDDVTTLLALVCLEVTDNETGKVVPVACAVTAGTKIVTNGALGSVVDTASGMYFVHGVAIDPTTADAVPMRIRSVAGPVEIDVHTFVADRDTNGSANPTVVAVNETLHAYGPLHGFEASGALDVTGADAVLLEAQRSDGDWELVANY